RKIKEAYTSLLMTSSVKSTSQIKPWHAPFTDPIKNKFKDGIKKVGSETLGQMLDSGPVGEGAKRLVHKTLLAHPVPEVNALYTPLKSASDGNPADVPAVAKQFQTFITSDKLDLLKDYPHSRTVLTEINERLQTLGVDQPTDPKEALLDMVLKFK